METGRGRGNVLGFQFLERKISGANCLGEMCGGKMFREMSGSLEYISL